MVIRNFRDIVYHNTGFNVLKATPEQIQEAKMNSILASYYQIDINGNVFKDKNGNLRKRPNECGNDMENVLKLSSNGKLSGLGKACAYPDLINTECREYYLECKVADYKSMDLVSAHFIFQHLQKLKSLKHIYSCVLNVMKRKLSKEDEPIVIDLYDLELTLKQEWNASNKVVYKII